jgi:EAL domain-containing protein (putative c-di-GMP-specific phosphodiesterase class I)
MRAETSDPEPDPDPDTDPGTDADTDVDPELEPESPGRRRRFRNPLSRLRRRGGPADEEPGGRRCLLLAEPAHIDAVRSKLAEGGVEVVSVALDMQSLMEGLSAFQPDLLVIDLPVTPTLMIEAVVSTRRHFPDVEVHVVMRGTAGALDEQAESAGADLIVYLDGEPANHEDQHSRAVASRVERALSGEGIYAVYQPVMNLRTGRVVGLEALARFRDGAGVSPRDRLEEAQRVGLRRELELAAVLASVEHIDLLPAAWFLAVNLSPATLMWTQFLDRLEELPLGRMWVEVNVRDEPTAWFERFSDVWPDGVARPQVALDDTGATAASLKAIHQLEPDVVKVAPELVRGIDHRPDQHALVSTIGVFAKEVGAVLLAEGVESKAEADTLESLGVRLAQGFLFGAPDRLDRERVRELKRQ